MKKILALILAFTMLMSMSVCLISCDGNDGGDDNGGNGGNGGTTDEKVTYTVTVTDEDGNPVSGVEITLSPKGGIPAPYETDKDGKVTYKTAKQLTAILTGIPEGYESDKEGVAQSFDENASLTIVLSKAEQGDPFVIKVIDQHGNPVAGVWVQICDTSCRLPIETGADGTASYPYESGSFRAQLNELPEGYTATDAEMKAYHDFVDGVATITITKLAD